MSTYSLDIVYENNPEANYYPGQTVRGAQKNFNEDFVQKTLSQFLSQK